MRAINILHKTLSKGDAIVLLMGTFHHVDKAICAALMVKHSLPMYQGELNPKWKFWDDVIEDLMDCDEIQEKTQDQFIKNKMGLFFPIRPKITLP